ncbi:MAG TPA: DNA repair protein RecO [Methylomirabilota bacterium]|nr:DNA repair protein RecO [Methylomirabilota bacterium]
MALYRTRALVTGRRALGESDRLVEFYTRDFGRLSGVARSARRPRSRLGGALEPFTLGELVFFDTGRSELVRINHFDPIHPFVRVREDLERLGQGAWMIECLTRLVADRDPQPPLFALAVRGLEALERVPRPGRVSMCFALRAVDLLGHRPRIDRCAGCGRPHPFPGAMLDVAAGGLVCGDCGAGADAVSVSGSAVGTLKRLRGLGWEQALRLRLAAELDVELEALVEGLVARLMGRPARSARFIAQTRSGLLRVAEPSPRPG